MARFIANGYNGEVLGDLLTYAAQGNDTYNEGLIHIQSGIEYKYTIPNIKLGSIIQDNVPTPTSTAYAAGGGAGADGASNNYTITQRYLMPTNFMVYMEFNPRDYEKYWKPFQPNGNLVFRDLAPAVQSTMLRLLMEEKAKYVGEAIWCSALGGTAASGITAPAGGTAIGGQADGGPMKYFDGVIKRLITNLSATSGDADQNEFLGGQVVLAGSTVLSTGQNVNDALYTMFQKCPKQIRKNANLSFVMDWATWDLYDEYMSAKENKYYDNTQINQYRFKGKRIIPIVGIPESTIMFTVFSQGMDSNLWMGVDYANDEEVVKIAPLQANSELYFFQMRMKMDVNIVRPAEIVLWTPYTKTA